MERLDKTDGIEASSANHTGTLVRVSVKAGMNRDKVADAVKKDLAAHKGNPTQIVGDGLAKALKEEEWRGIERIGQLSAIEFRKINLDRVKSFVEQEKLDGGVARKLLALAEGEWDAMMKAAETREGARPPHRTDWAGRCGRFAKVVVKKSKAILTADQPDRLRQALACRFE